MLAAASAAHALDFIDSPTERIFFDGGLRIKAEAKDGHVFWTAQRGTASGGNRESEIKAGSRWFIAAESDSEVWIFDGEKALTLVQFTDKGIKFTGSSVVPELGRQAPKEVQDRIASTASN